MGMRDQQLFISNTRQRVSQLIGTGIWEGVDGSRVNDWFRQFEEADCALLGACLLDNLTYRSKQQVLALFKAALTTSQLLSSDTSSDLMIIEALRGRRDPGIRLIPVISPDQPPTKSGPYMLRLLSRGLRIREKWMVWTSELGSVPENVHSVIAVDDFCGSGKQFVERFLALPEVAEFRRCRPECKFIYVAAAAHRDGIGSIREAAQDVEIVSGEILSTEHHFFDGTVLNQYQSDGLKAALLDQHDRMLAQVHLNGSVGKFGFGSLGLTYAFAHGTPNNTLPVLWYDNTDGWTSLLDR